MMGGLKPVRNAKYLAWIRTHPCVVCGGARGIEASHTGPHGLGLKSPDSSAIPFVRSITEPAMTVTISWVPGNFRKAGWEPTCV
jgi:hypothetical protein